MAGRFVINVAALLAGFVVVQAAASPLSADEREVADFYRGKTLKMVIPSSPGGDYDTRARLVARHLGQHIPGKPHILPMNMPGGSGVTGANFLASAAAPHDGTVLEILLQNMAVHQATGGQGTAFDVKAFGWIGNTTSSPNLISAWHTTGIRTLQDAKSRELVVGSPAATAGVIYPTAMNVLVGTKFKIVTGYPSGTYVNLAMERGEVGGRGSNSWAAWKATKPEWIRERKLYHLVQVALKRDPELSEVPLMHELAKTTEDAEVLRFLSADVAISRAIVTTPDVPSSRLNALRRAFDAMIADPAFLADAEKSNIDISATTGEIAQEVATSIVAASPAVVAKAKAIMQTK
jgi:tripartite-type tricarboxylate transporter receptor subunit TctC